MYYYLNTDKKPTGPHSLAELGELMQQGIITPATLVAPVGGESWQPLGTVLMKASEAGEDLPPVPGIQGEVACPYCGQEFTAKHSGLPEQCPHCGTTLHAQNRGLWSNFCLALRRIPQIRGRSTRKEYWGTLLCYLLLVLALVIGLLIGLSFCVTSGTMELSTAIKAGFAGYIVIALFSYVLGCTVQVRRLHDVGWSGWWVALSLALGIGLGFLADTYTDAWKLVNLPVWKYDMNTPCVRERAEKMAQEPLAEGEEPYTAEMIIEAALLEEYNAAISAYQLQAAEKQLHMNPWMGLITLGGYALSILLFVLTLLDSKRGSNKYGPSAKYPLG